MGFAMPVLLTSFLPLLMRLLSPYSFLDTMVLSPPHGRTRPTITRRRVVQHHLHPHHHGGCSHQRHWRRLCAATRPALGSGGNGGTGDARRVCVNSMAALAIREPDDVALFALYVSNPRATTLVCNMNVCPLLYKSTHVGDPAAPAPTRAPSTAALHPAKGTISGRQRGRRRGGRPRP